MADPVPGSLLHQEFASGSSWAVTATPDHLVDDVIVAVVHVDGSNYATGATGWTAIGTRTGTPTAGTNMQAFYKVAASSGTGEAPTFTISGSDDGFVSMFLIRDCDTAAVVNVVSSQTDWNLVNTAESATPTTTADGCLLVYLWSSDGSVLMRTDLSDASMIGTYRHLGAGAVSGVISYRQQETAGAAPAVTMMTTSSAEGGTSWVIGFNNKTGGRLAPDVRSTISKVNEYGLVGPAVTWYGPNQTGNAFAGGITSLNGITLQTAAASAADGNTYDILTTTTTDNRLDGGWHAISSTNMDGRLFSFEAQTSRPGVVSTGRIGAEGLLVGFTDGTNYEFHRALSSVATFSALTWYRSTVACGVTDPAYSSGTLDWTAITGICYLLHHLNTSADTLWVKDAYLIDNFAVTGGNVANPSSFRDFGLRLIGHPSIDLVKLQGGSQTLAYFNIQIGDGTNTTVFDASASPVTYPQEWGNVSNTTKQALWNVPENVVSVNVKASASDVINLTATSIYASVKQAFTIDAASSASAEYSTLGLAIIGFDVTDNLGLTWNGATFSDCGTVTIAGGGDLTNCTINNTTSTNAALAITANGSTLDGCTIDGTGAAYALELGTAVTAITLTDCTITAGSTDKVHVLATTGTVTITISGTTSLVAGDVTSAGAMVDISAPVEYQSVTLSNYVTGSRIQVYDTTNGAELYNDIPAAAPQTLWTDSVAASTSGARDIRVRVAYVSGTTAKQFIEAAIGTAAASGAGIALSYRVNQSADTVYDANGLNGSTIYGSGEITFTDSSPDVINMDMAADTISLPTQYAAWVYYAFTATGIATDIDYINAIDTANYEYSGIKWKNTSSPTSPLKVTGGYAWDSTTLDPIDLIDTTGGTIFLTPAHVVAYQTTGTYAITGNISTVLAAIPSATDNATAVLSAAASAPIAADVKKMNAATVAGTGQEGDLWRGA